MNSGENLRRKSGRDMKCKNR